MNSSRVRNIVSWVLTVLLFAGYLMAALGKLTGAATDMFLAWGYSTWFPILIGTLELLGAVGLVIPRTRPWATLGLSGIMLGAVYTHLTNNEAEQVVRPLLFLVLLGILWWLRRGKSEDSKN